MKKFKLPTIIMSGIIIILILVIATIIPENNELNIRIEEMIQTIANLNGTYSEILTKYNKIEESYNDQQKEIESLISQNANLSEANVSLEKQLNDLKTKNTELINQNSSLQTEIDNIKTTANNLLDEITTAYSNKDYSKVITLSEEMNLKYNKLSVNTTAQTFAIQAKTALENIEKEKASSKPEPVASTVYWVKNGVVWHLSINCTSLKRSKNIYSGTVTESGKPRSCNLCS